MLNRIASLLGGRAAEEVIIGDISTGAHNDLARATDIARSMVKEYGMSEKLGQVYLSHDKGPQFLEAGFGKPNDYSEDTARSIDDEVREIIQAQYKEALSILNKSRDVLVRGARLLLEKEKIDGEEIRALFEHQ